MILKSAKKSYNSDIYLAIEKKRKKSILQPYQPFVGAAFNWILDSAVYHVKPSENKDETCNKTKFTRSAVF